MHTWSHVAAIEATRGRSVMIDDDTFTSPDTGRIARLAAGAARRRRRAGERRARPCPAARAPRGARAGHGILLLQQRRDRGCRSPSGRRRHASPSSTSTSTTATAPSGCSTATAPCCSSRRTNGRSIPGPGAATDIGSGDGLGHTVNIPIEAGATDGDYLEILDAVVVPVLADYAPELVIVSAGFDAHEDDPLAQMRLTTPGYRAVAARLRDAARQANGPIVVRDRGRLRARRARRVARRRRRRAARRGRRTRASRRGRPPDAARVRLPRCARPRARGGVVYNS